MKSLKGILYYSKENIAFDDMSLIELAENASKFNEKSEITGYLYYYSGYFMQYIEGEMMTVEDLMNHIEKDSRHEVLYILKTDKLDKRKFPKWHMQYLTKKLISYITFEQLIVDHMEHVKKIARISKSNKFLFLLEETENITWRLVDRLAEQKQKATNNQGRIK